MFDTILGHDAIKKKLEKDLQSGVFHQSYLFSGPQHCGKMTLVRAFFEQGSSFAVPLTAGQGQGFLTFFDHGETLKVEEVRSMKHFDSFRTGEKERSFVVIEHMERMTKSAANAFLKILEEPSERLIFLLTTRNERKLLPTIRSRVQLFRCTAPPIKKVELMLRGKVHDEILLEELLKLSAGRVGLALGLLSDEALLEQSRRLWDYAQLMPEKDLIDRFALAEHLVSDEYSETQRSQFLFFLTQKLRAENLELWKTSLESLQRVHLGFQESQINRRLAFEHLFLQMEEG